MTQVDFERILKNHSVSYRMLNGVLHAEIRGYSKATKVLSCTLEPVRTITELKDALGY